MKKLLRFSGKNWTLSVYQEAYIEDHVFFHLTIADWIGKLGSVSLQDLNMLLTGKNTIRVFAAIFQIQSKAVDLDIKSYFVRKYVRSKIYLILFQLQQTISCRSTRFSDAI